MTNREIQTRDTISKLLHRMELEKLETVLKYMNGLAQSDYDWADDLTEEQLAQIQQGTEDIEQGKYVTSEQLHEETKAFFERKRKEK